MFTPGPWIMVNDRTVNGPHGDRVASTKFSYPFPVEHEANARLIAAAPELLESLQSTLSELIRMYHEHEEMEIPNSNGLEIEAKIDAAFSAIAKATGK